ncbi:MAG: DUF2029 domain-containing protein [Chloroflexi bacterium]|nr:DUF2029 domain-containing protein [Chloroflexota bacterium]MCI0579646.1 DUF2029 domain-containing protein [Chloroflexota bacterium]
MLFILQVVGMHATFARQVTAAADFHSRWYGARALLLEGRDPYSPEVTAEIEAIRDPNQRRTNSFSFAFPLHVIFVFWPLAYLPYDWAQVAWMVALQWMAIAIAAGMLLLEGWRPAPAAAAGVILATLFFYPAARTILLGQFTLPVTLFLVLCLLAWQRGRDGRAGFWLAATSIKPQMVVLVGLWLVLWAISRRRWRFVRGMLLGGGLMLAASLALLPRWPLSFLEDVQRYAEVASGRHPLDVLLEMAWPGASRLAFYLLAAVLLLLMGLAWWRGWGQDGPRATRALYWTMAVTLLVLFQTGSTNQAILLIPLLAWLAEVNRRWGRWPALLGAAVLVVAPWVLFLNTIRGNYENPLLLLPLPFFCLAVLFILDFRFWILDRESKIQNLKSKIQ